MTYGYYRASDLDSHTDTAINDELPESESPADDSVAEPVPTDEGLVEADPDPTQTPVIEDPEEAE